MTVDPRGRFVHSLADAENYILKFIADGLVEEVARVRAKSHDFDLYLPWLMEIVDSVPAKDAPDALPVAELEQLYMDAAWALVMKGFLRPGPRKTAGVCPGDSYGKGYSLTSSGMERIGSGKRSIETGPPASSRTKTP